jgi:hypothetical protein
MANTICGGSRIPIGQAVKKSDALTPSKEVRSTQPIGIGEKFSSSEMPAQDILADPFFSSDTLTFPN